MLENCQGCKKNHIQPATIDYQQINNQAWAALNQDDLPTYHKRLEALQDELRKANNSAAIDELETYIQELSFEKIKKDAGNLEKRAFWAKDALLQRTSQAKNLVDSIKAEHTTLTREQASQTQTKPRLHTKDTKDAVQAATRAVDAMQDSTTLHQGPPAGIPNLGKTCYINAALQVIAHSHLLVQEVLKHNTTQKLPSILHAIQAGKEITPSDIQELLAQKICHHEDKEKDTTDFLKEKLLPICNGIIGINNTSIQEGRSMEQYMHAYWQTQKQQLPHHQYVLFVQVERMDNKNKITTPIQHPFSYTIPPEYTQEKHPVQVTLTAFIVHEGNQTNTGHFIAYIKKANQWYCANDENVSTVTDQAAEQQAEQAYLFFYQKQ